MIFITPLKKKSSSNSKRLNFMTACPVDLATTKKGVGGSSIKNFDNCIFLQNETNRGDNKTVNRMNMYTDFGLV